MGKETGIAWCDHTYNSWWGCTKVSPACDFCYAEALSKQYGHDIWGSTAPRRFFGEKHWQEPHKWNAEAKKAGVRKRVFLNSMSDFFASAFHLCGSCQCLDRKSTRLNSSHTVNSYSVFCFEKKKTERRKL